MKKIIVANWKANFSTDNVEKWMQTFIAHYRPQNNSRVVLAVPFLYMERVYSEVRGVAGVTLAAQGVSPYPGGNYTGATPARWLKNMVGYALLGHRERRKYFHETVQDIAAQARECVALGIRPILCLDAEGLSDMRAALDSREFAEVICAYAPDTAVAQETALDVEEIQAGVARVSGYFPNRPVLYGGGVNDENASSILALPEVSGIMLGRGCLEAERFARFCSKA